MKHSRTKSTRAETAAETIKWKSVARVTRAASDWLSQWRSAHKGGLCPAVIIRWGNFVGGKLFRRYDWLMYRLAYRYLIRIFRNNPGMAYLTELRMRDYVESLKISPQLRIATKHFHESMKNIPEK